MTYTDQIRRLLYSDFSTFWVRKNLDTTRFE